MMVQRDDRSLLRSLRVWSLAVLVTAGILSASGLTAHGAEAAAEKLPKGMKIVKLEVRPKAIALKNAYDYAQVLLTGVAKSGERVDLTRLVQSKVPEQLVKLSERGLVRPAGDGEGEIKFTFDGQSVSLPVAVSGYGDEFHPSFIRDVGPAMSKLGCNQGTCHGAAQGKNGFKLSLRGYDPLFDHRALTDDLAGRRFNRAAPDQSLMLLKPAGGVPHVGGALMHPGEPYYELLRTWIADGVTLDLDSPRVKSISVQPKEPRLPLPGMKQQMTVLATYTDGATRDVTAEAFLETSLAEIVEVDKQGLATAVRRGEAAILARYEGAYDATTVIVMGDRTGFVWKDVPTNNHIDQLVYEKLKQVKVEPAGLCTDAEFIRRVYLDLIGLPPTPEEVRAFLADERDTQVKRDELIDRLVGSEGYVEYWTNKWADMLQVNRKFLGEQGAWAFHNWIQQAVATNMPYDKFVHTILTGSGSTLDNPPASYYKVLRAPGDTMENTTQLFLAVRFSCNKCHDHPFERWTQDQYYHMAAYFAQVGRKPDAEFGNKKLGGTAVEEALPAVEVVYDAKTGEVTHDRTGQVTAPAVPYQPNLASDTGTRREEVAHWITSPDNQYFAKSYVNRVWSYLLGVGIIEPVDDIRAGNPPTNPKLLDRMTKDFIDSGFDVQKLMRTICKSRVYQHSIQTTRWNDDDQTNYSHAMARRLQAETLYDAVHRVTGSKSNLPGLPIGFRASQTPDSTVKLDDGFLELFGRPARESACECERSSGVMLGQALNLVNGTTIGEAIADPKNRITKLVKTQPDDRKLIEELFVAILNRLPTDKEIEGSLETLKPDPMELQRAEEAMARYTRDTLPQQAIDWEVDYRASEWHPLDPTSMTSAAGAMLAKRKDRSILVTGHSPAKDVVTIVAATDRVGITGIKLEVLPDASLPGKGPGRSASGNFALQNFTLASAAVGNELAPQSVTLTAAQADFEQMGNEVSKAIDGDLKSGWGIKPAFGKPHVAVFETQNDIGAVGGTVLTVTMSQQLGTQHTIGKFRLSVTTAPRPLKLDRGTLPKDIAATIALEPGQRTEAQKAALLKYVASIDPKHQRLAKSLDIVTKGSTEYRLRGAQDLAWALLNTPAFLFNR